MQWRPEPTHVEKCGDELGVAVKFQSNSEIAGSPRNSFRASVLGKSHGGRALIGLGVLPGLPNSVKLRMPSTYTRAVRLRVLRSVVKRETAQTNS